MPCRKQTALLAGQRLKSFFCWWLARASSASGAVIATAATTDALGRYDTEQHAIYGSGRCHMTVWQGETREQHCPLVGTLQEVVVLSMTAAVICKPPCITESAPACRLGHIRNDRKKHVCFQLALFCVLCVS